MTSEFDRFDLSGEAPVAATVAGLLDDDPGGTQRKEEWEVGAGLVHEPVMRADVVRLLLPMPRPGLRLVDLTVGLGGHAEALLTAAPPDAELLAIDRDPVALDRARERLGRFGDRVHVVRAPFSTVADAMGSIGWTRADGILADLGVSSMQLDDAQRGFSFQSDAPLDMRMDPTGGESAAELVERLDEAELGALIRELGEERAGRRIARVIKRSDEAPTTTGALRAAVRRAVGGQRGRKHDPSTLTFQALRIAVNRELDELDSLLAALPDRLTERGRAVILSYHSLEDRRVKRAFALWAKSCVCPPALPVCQCGGLARAKVLTRRVATPSEDEIAMNSRARSARLRAIEWLEAGEGR